MRKLISITQVSIDGVMQSPGGADEDPSNGFKHGGWFMHFGDKSLEESVSKTMSGEFDMLLGRKTYEIFAAYWPNQQNEIGKAFDKARKYVVTRTLKDLDWENSRRLGDDVLEELRKIKESEGPPIHIWGSGNLLQTLIAAGLVDEFRLWIAPVLLGEGKRLFENGIPAGTLELIDTVKTSTGVLINRYRPAGGLAET